MFIIYYRNSKLDIKRTLISYIKYRIRTGVFPTLLINK